MVYVYISVKMGYFLKNFVVTLFFSWCITRCYVLTAIATVVFLRAELESAVLSYLPSQQMWEYLLTRILSVAVLLGSIISRCMTVFVYPFFSLLFFKIQNNKTVEICWNERERTQEVFCVFLQLPSEGKGSQKHRAQQKNYYRPTMCCEYLLSLQLLSGNNAVYHQASTYCMSGL